MSGITSSFKEKINAVIGMERPFVLYRKPKAEEVVLITQNTNDVFELSSYAAAGFVFVPFTSNHKKVIFPLSKSEIFKYATEELIAIDHDSRLEMHEMTTEASSRVHHIDLVKKGIEFMEQSTVKKVVLSRVESVECKDLDLIQTFTSMLKAYKNALVYVWFHPGIGQWMGATPERLVDLQGNSFKTMSLAGTQPFIDNVEVTWNPKEINEQKFVTDYILEKLKSYCTIEKLTGPYTVKAGSLVHLRTDVQGTLKHSEHLAKLVDSIHPTPAVCGLPKMESLDFILHNEGYDRSYYTGYLGELNIEQHTNLYVNLRCAKYEDSHLKIFVGGGITSASNPIKEWEETVVKSNIMKSVIFKNS